MSPLRCWWYRWGVLSRSFVILVRQSGLSEICALSLPLNVMMDLSSHGSRRVYRWSRVMERFLFEGIGVIDRDVANDRRVYQAGLITLGDVGVFSNEQARKDDTRVTRLGRDCARRDCSLTAPHRGYNDLRYQRLLLPLPVLAIKGCSEILYPYQYQCQY